MPNHIRDSKHPTYDDILFHAKKWRLTMEAGHKYIIEYLRKFTHREEISAYNIRRDITYVPAFAKSAVMDIRNAIFQRLRDVTRIGGSQSYKQAIEGEDGGVDFTGNSMNSFMGRIVLRELLSMKRVGIYVDMPNLIPTTLAGQEERPYIYIYKTEDIRNWLYDSNNVLVQLIVSVNQFTLDNFGLPTGTTRIFRHFHLSEGRVIVDDFWESGKKIITRIIEVPRIPITILELSESLLADVADIQVALLNLASSDINFTLQANFPFYTEQADMRANALHLRTNDDADTKGAIDQSNKIDTGVSQGRLYDKNMERPAFIHPSPEPLKVSMQKQEQLKIEIKQLVNLSLSSIKPSRQSAESKEMDERGLEAGLSNIGLELAYGETQIAEFWAAYESRTSDVKIHYPTRYSIKSDEERLREAEKTDAVAKKIPSTTFRRITQKLIAKTLVGDKVSADSLQIIESEIEEADVINLGNISEDLEAGILSAATAAEARGYPENEAVAAQTEHAERLKLIQQAQEPVTGNQDTDNPGAATRQKELIAIKDKK